MKSVNLIINTENQDELQDYIKEQFQFLDYYGMNLDAFHDCLTEIGEETIIYTILKKPSVYADKLLKVLNVSCQENPNIKIVKMDILELLKKEMIEYEKGVTHRIQHFLKVHSFAHLIGQMEGLDADTLFVLETASLVHDIGIQPSLKKYGNSIGVNQEKEGIQPAKELLTKLQYDTSIIERVCFLVGHHHTYHLEEGMDYQILLEADFLVNCFEDNMSKEQIKAFRDTVFKTKSGIFLLNTMVGMEN